MKKLSQNHRIGGLKVFTGSVVCGSVLYCTIVVCLCRFRFTPPLFTPSASVIRQPSTLTLMTNGAWHRTHDVDVNGLRSSSQGIPGCFSYGDNITLKYKNSQPDFGHPNYHSQCVLTGKLLVIAHEANTGPGFLLLKSWVLSPPNSEKPKEMTGLDG